jgi:hypothetical protein
MSFFGKILLFIGGIGFLVWGVSSSIALVTTLVKSPATYFGSSAGLWAFVFAVLWLLLDLFGGFSGIVFALFSKRWGWVQTLSIAIIVLFILSLVDLIIGGIRYGNWTWGSWSSLVYGGVAGLLYVLGYFLCHKRRH